MKRPVHIGWLLCAILLAVIIVANQYGDAITKMLTGR